MVKEFYPGTNQEMPPYRQFQDVHVIRNMNILKWWINSKQITSDQLSTEQRISLKIAEIREMKIEERPQDVTFGEVYK